MYDFYDMTTPSPDSGYLRGGRPSVGELTFRAKYKMLPLNSLSERPAAGACGTTVTFRELPQRVDLDAMKERPVPEEHRTGRSEPGFRDVRSDRDAVDFASASVREACGTQIQGDQTSYSRTLNAEK